MSDVMAELVADEDSDDDFDGHLMDSKGNLNVHGGDVAAEFRVNRTKMLTTSHEFSLYMFTHFDTLM